MIENCPCGARHGMDAHLGLSHISKEIGPITYCGACEHWFSREDRVKYFERGLEALKELIGGRQEGCCGPPGTTGGMLWTRGPREE